MRKLSNLQQEVFLDRYALRDENGELLEHDVEEMWHRVAHAVAQAEANPEEWEPKFYSILEDFKFVPGGRVLKGAGSKHDLTYYNCFVIPSPEDSRQGIMETATQLVEIMSHGGGVGVNLSTLRPRGAIVRGVNGISSGAVSWGEIYSQVAGCVTQGGSRRGAEMLMLNVDHPDIEEFIQVKQDLSRLTNANLSVGITDGFMQAVKEDKDWRLVFNGKIYKKVQARKLWELICEFAWRCGEPGLVFLNRYNETSNTYYYDPIVCCNPCGEQGLPAWGACNLGHINLTKFNLNGVNDLERTVRIAVRFLDDVIDITPYIYSKNKKSQLDSRRIGLGTMGLADLLIKERIRYGSKDALKYVDELYRYIAHIAYNESIHIAKEKGAFKKFDGNKYLNGAFIQRLSKYIREDIARYGIRNSVLLTQAPTGTIGVLANVSSGIEPNFAWEYKRKDRTGEHIIKHPLYEEWANKYSHNTPDYFVTAGELTPQEHIQMQAAIQKWTDSSISKTINFPNTATVDDVKNAYMMAYDMGCKGITVYREGSRDSVLTKLDNNINKQENTQQTPNKPRKRPVIVDAPARRIKVKTGCGSLWLTLVFDDNGNLREIFTVTGHSGGCACSTEALSRMVSCALRYDIPPEEVAKQLSEIKPCRSFDRAKQKDPTITANSCPHAIAQEVMKHLKKQPQKESVKKSANTCPDCGATLDRVEGCLTCRSCGYSRCS